MRKLAVIAGLAAVGLGTQTTAFAYATTANLTFSWGGATSTDIGWTSSGGTAVLASFDNTSYLSTYTGNNSTNYYNSDFATADQCATLVAAVGGTPTATRKYGCRYTSAGSSASFLSTPVNDTGPGASASGVLTVTDTTLTGTLTIVGTTDELTGGTATSVGNGSNGYNLRQADGSPFGNSWGGVTTLGTYTVALTGTFTASSWQITGGAAKFSDSGYLCQQGGNSTPANILCTASGAPGGFTTTGGSLSWGWELDGAASGSGNVVAGIDVRDASNVLITTLSGVLANLSVDAAGNVTTNAGEIRRGLGSSAGCGGGPTQKNVTYSAALTTMTCGTITTAGLNVTGTADVVPIPAAVWLFGSALGLLGVARRRMAA